MVPQYYHHKCFKSYHLNDLNKIWNKIPCIIKSTYPSSCLRVDTHTIFAIIKIIPTQCIYTHDLFSLPFHDSATTVDYSDPPWSNIGK